MMKSWPVYLTGPTHTCAGAPVSAAGISGLPVKNSLNRSLSLPSQSSGLSWSSRIS